MNKGLIGKKIGMTQIFDEKGNVIPVTVIECGPCVVAQKKTVENDGYDAIQLGFMDAKAKHVNKAEKGHFAKAGVANKRHLKEFRLEDCSAVTAAVVKDGKIVGVMMKNDSGREVFCPPEKCICTYYAEDNNGAGYKTREEYTYLICVSKDSE